MSKKLQNQLKWVAILTIIAGMIIVGSAGALGFGQLPMDTARYLLLLIIGAGAVVILSSIWMFGVSLRPAEPEEPAEPEQEPEIQAAPPPKRTAADVHVGVEALTFLSLLQEKGRLVDFISEDITAYSNEQVGAAARVVHQGCRQVITDNFDPAPIVEEGEGNETVLESGYDSSRYRLAGSPGNEPPHTGKVTHKGWIARRIRMARPSNPEAIAENPVIVPAEVQVGK